jgi:hypothetical protein
MSFADQTAHGLRDPQTAFSMEGKGHGVFIISGRFGEALAYYPASESLDRYRIKQFSRRSEIPPDSGQVKFTE